MDNILTNITEFLKTLFHSTAQALGDLLKDTVYFLFDMVLNTITTLIGLIPAPCCFTDYGSSGSSSGSFSTISDLLTILPPFTLYVLNQIDIIGAFHAITCAMEFYMLRKICTMGQW